MREWIEKASSGHALTAEEAERAFGTLMAGEASPVETAAFLVALRTRGTTSSEIAGGVRALRRAMVEVPLPTDGLVDTCGTGGGRVPTFNISTAAALVAAGAGARVAKHGNRSFTSRCGSADVLEALGVEIGLDPGKMPEVFEATGIVFMFAPLHHPAMRHVGPVRRELGVRTVMNLLGPLTSPARVRRQLVGVSDPELVPLIAGALRELGHERALVVHGEPGMDELSPLGPTRGVSVEAGETKPFELRPEELGWEPFGTSELTGGGPAENAARIRGLLAGEERGAARAAVALNAAAALYVSGLVEDVPAGIALAEEALDSGAARGALEKLRRSTRRAAGAP